MSTLGRRLHRLLEHPEPDPRATWVRRFIVALIIANVVFVVVESEMALSQRLASGLWAFTWFSAVAFTLEYIARFVAVGGDATNEEGFARLRFFLRPLSLLDLLATSSLWLSIGGLGDWGVLALCRVLRLFSLSRYSHNVTVLGRTLHQARHELATVLAGLLMLIALAATVVHLAERNAQPEMFDSIPSSAWWALSAATTVGYGDITPITPFGRLAAAVASILGIALFALPAGILASAFVEAGRGPKTCPHCGGSLTLNNRESA